jgi:hypothetical protein
MMVLALFDETNYKQKTAFFVQDMIARGTNMIAGI